jgi:hypothetical protein
MESEQPKPAPPAEGKPKARALTDVFIERVEQGILALRNRAKARPRQTVTERVGTGPTQELSVHFQEYAWARSAPAWLIVATGVCLALAVAIWVGVVLVIARPQGIVVMGPSFNDVVDEETNRVFVAKRDSLEYFVWSVLKAKNDLSPDMFTGSATTEPSTILRGLVNPDILEKMDKSFEKNLNVIRRNLITRVLAIEAIGNIVEQTESNRVSVYIRGKITITQEVGDKGPTVRHIDYRARAVLDVVVPTASNHQHFYMVDLEERVGPQAPQWDKQQPISRQ